MVGVHHHRGESESNIPLRRPSPDCFAATNDLNQINMMPNGVSITFSNIQNNDLFINQKKVRYNCL